MRSMGTVASAITVAAMVIGGSSTAPPARASTDGPAINGTYRATSVGEWAKTNQSFHDEPTVSSTWTVSSSCATAQDCTGHVTSDQGWSAPLYMHDGVMWTVKHEVPNWETCPDGTSFTGVQTFTFYPAGPDGTVQTGSPTLAGKDQTVGPSGACGVNKWLVVMMPFRLDRI
ncbi:MAG: hypothetical protein K2X56_20670 [Mycobacterium pseudokansasii]|uniref:Secreted protein n=1 Tax=Mycobacterium pseudokansasii TaxID=2341080 RepID=A0A498R323_9MYCO|nr:hypothetical protein [Mycobacterium pseudokansasii]KZS68332.1 hypothetical protein A4G27_09210 [Mycobacterium kansasii]MBY0390437.1 hypothetical protein [Mycobacterium pseudokansasii]VBA30847.1 hypothetical protein LAUMK35_04862 [Mycobacterium pseudokansasii]VBA32772.1 hypothetical protein LAUMK21_04852 [Mycobacterium pseudokansasii]VBA54711.1 hypothetical protein LAUMK142_04766 [Mycobacterium pseudokansasii]